MLTGTFTLETATPPQAVWTYLADLRSHVDWRDDVISCEIETGQPGADGAVYRQHVRQGPATAWRQLRAHIDPAGTVEFITLGHSPVRARGTTSITDGPDGGAIVDAAIQLSFRGPGRLLRPVVTRELDRRMTTYPKALKNRLDALGAGGD